MLDEMVNRAIKVMQNAYSPYSKFKVGVCVRSQQKLFVGCNVENISFSATQCAEYSAIGSMVAAGFKTIDELVVVSSGETLVTPCGKCRQFIFELAASSKIPIHCGDKGGIKKTIAIEDLLPFAFAEKSLQQYMRKK